MKKKLIDKIKLFNKDFNSLVELNIDSATGKLFNLNQEEIKVKNYRELVYINKKYVTQIDNIVLNELLLISIPKNANGYSVGEYFIMDLGGDNLVYGIQFYDF